MWQLKYVLHLTDHWLENSNLDLFSQDFFKIHLMSPEELRGKALITAMSTHLNSFPLMILFHIPPSR